MTHKINLERVYEDASGTLADGFRVLVDRLWPRGESKAVFHYDLWAKDITPSADLREWFHADPDSRWEEFAKRYEDELDANPATPEFLDKLRPHPVVTLLYGSRDEIHNNAVVLRQYLQQRL